MCLPADMRARVLRTVIESTADEVRTAGFAPAVAARLGGMLADAHRHAVELEEALQPITAAPEPWAPPPSPRRRVRYSEPGSNVITLRAG